MPIPPADDLAGNVRWLRDRELIRELPQRYALGIDTDDWATVASVFHPDCHVEGTVQSAPIAEYLEALEPGVKQYHATLHFMGNQYVVVEGDTGHVETYAVAYHIEADDSPLQDLLMGVRYQDDVVRAGQEWKISHRRVVKQWSRGPLPRPTSEA
ncbi:nuclear transport factor 2 family protein [Myxococcota bacterium]|nr:nuclear transport factor 2 family protein [Myxococcota bacterium]